MKFLRRILILLAVLLLLPIPARAAEGSITVEHKLEDGTPLTGVTFRLYRMENSVSDVRDAYAEVLQSGQEALDSGVTDAQGRIVFSNLEDGAYLLVGQSHRMGEQVCQIDMSLLTIPGTAPEGNVSSHITVYPKYELKEDTSKTEYRVIVIWMEPKSSITHPDSVEIYRYRNGEHYDTITVGTAENWQYSWEELDLTAVWSVVEEVPTGYTVTYDRDGNTFLIYNQPEVVEPTDPSDPSDPSNPSDPSETTPTEPDGPKLPQTGQLWWPVPVMAIVGMVLVLLGWLRRKESLDEA